MYSLETIVSMNDRKVERWRANIRLAYREARPGATDAEVQDWMELSFGSGQRVEESL